jgi:hypothetical protein
VRSACTGGAWKLQRPSSASLAGTLNATHKVLAAGDTRVLVKTHEGVNIYEVTEGGKKYYISDPIYDETVHADTVYDVALEITRKHAMVGV